MKESKARHVRYAIHRDGSYMNEAGGWVDTLEKAFLYTKAEWENDGGDEELLEPGEERVEVVVNLRAVEKRRWTEKPKKFTQQDNVRRYEVHSRAPLDVTIVEERIDPTKPTLTVWVQGDIDDTCSPPANAHDHVLKLVARYGVDWSTHAPREWYE